MAQIEIGQLPLTTSFTNTTFIAVENANVTQKIEASSIRNYVTTLDFVNSTGNVTAANLVTAGNVHAAKGLFTDVITSTVATGTAPFSVASTTQVTNLYASRAAVADTTTNGLTTSSAFANVAGADVIISGNNSALSSNLRTVNTTVGTFGNTFTVPQLTVDSKGRITAVSNVAITFPAQTLLANTTEITANTVSGTPGLNLTATGVAAGTYGGAINIPQITVDAKGRVTGVTSIPINSTLNTLNIGIPIGTVAIWTGALNTVPDGWQVADGTNGTLDLRDRFIVGAGSLYNNGTTGGSTESRLPSHTHTANSTSTFAGNPLAGHTHGVTDPGHAHTARLYYYDASAPRQYFRGSHGANDSGTSVPTDTSTTGITINSQTGGTPTGAVTTTTTNSTEGVNPSNGNLPPYMALYYIQKMTDSVSINNPINYMSTVGTVTSGGNLVAASSNVSVSTSTGALVVVGGAGVGGNLNVGGNVNVSGVVTTPTMPTGTANTAVATTAFVQVNGSPTGGLMMWPTVTPPTGWLLCNGQAVSRTTYAGLFTVVGTIFGTGDGSSTFNLPDYRDRMPVGAGTTFSANTAGGSKDAVVVAHTHTVTITDPGHKHTFPTRYDYTGGGHGFQSPYNGLGTNVNSDTSTATTGITAAASSSGVAGTNANMPPYLGIYFIIKA
jgi:microcystin-dependent protein